jgi:hypothetical protein
MRDLKDFLGPYFAAQRIERKDWALFWFRDVKSDAMPAGRLRSEVEFHQTAAKITHGNPLVTAHGVHLADCDLLLTCDRRFFEVLQLVVLEGAPGARLGSGASIPRGARRSERPRRAHGYARFGGRLRRVMNPRFPDGCIFPPRQSPTKSAFQNLSVALRVAGPDQPTSRPDRPTAKRRCDANAQPSGFETRSKPLGRLPTRTGRAGAPIRGPGLCHDVTPWAHHNRVLLCQATLSIGPYLLLKVQFQHRLFTPHMPAFKREKVGAPIRDPGPVIGVVSAAPLVWGAPSPVTAGAGGAG